MEIRSKSDRNRIGLSKSDGNWIGNKNVARTSLNEFPPKSPAVSGLDMAPMWEVCVFPRFHAFLIENDVSFTHLAKRNKEVFEWP